MAVPLTALRYDPTVLAYGVMDRAELEHDTVSRGDYMIFRGILALDDVITSTN